MEVFTDIHLEEYERFLELIEKSIFSSGKISDVEFNTVKLFLDRISNDAYINADFITKIRLKYIYAV